MIFTRELVEDWRIHDPNPMATRLTLMSYLPPLWIYRIPTGVLPVLVPALVLVPMLVPVVVPVLVLVAVLDAVLVTALVRVLLFGASVDTCVGADVDVGIAANNFGRRAE